MGLKCFYVTPVNEGGMFCLFVLHILSYKVNSVILILILSIFGFLYLSDMLFEELARKEISNMLGGKLLR